MPSGFLTAGGYRCICSAVGAQFSLACFEIFRHRNTSSTGAAGKAGRNAAYRRRAAARRLRLCGDREKKATKTRDRYGNWVSKRTPRKIRGESRRISGKDTARAPATLSFHGVIYAFQKTTGAGYGAVRTRTAPFPGKRAAQIPPAGAEVRLAVTMVVMRIADDRSARVAPFRYSRDRERRRHVNRVADERAGEDTPGWIKSVNPGRAAADAA